MPHQLYSIGNLMMLLVITTSKIITCQSTAGITNVNTNDMPLHASLYPAIMAHRGCCANGIGGHAPENTILAFEYANSVGASIFETDLRFTHDDNVVIMHDDTLDRTTNCSGPVSNWTLADIQSRCEAYSWLNPKFSVAGHRVRVPSLQDLMTFLANTNMTCVLDLKERGLTPHVLRAAAATPNLDSSQLVPSINYRDDAPSVVSGLRRSTVVLNPSADSPVPSDIAGLPGAGYFGDLREAGVDVLFPSHRIRSPSIGELGVAAARYGFQIWTWTVDTPGEWMAAAMAGVRVVCTNDPKGALLEYRTQISCLDESCLTDAAFETG